MTLLTSPPLLSRLPAIDGSIRRLRCIPADLLAALTHFFLKYKPPTLSRLPSPRAHLCLSPPSALQRLSDLKTPPRRGVTGQQEKKVYHSLLDNLYPFSSLTCSF